MKSKSGKETPSQIYSLEERIQIWEDGGRLCHYCDRLLHRPGTKMGRNTHFDHIVARAVGGSHDLTNLVVCCKVCNREKGKKTYISFLQGRREQALKQVKRLSKLLARYNHGKT
jgi:5-methylcytosine-specific restriction endonuclease McrA